MHTQGHARTNLRDKLSNGTRLMPGVDLRTAAGRRYRYLIESYSDELGAALTEPEKALVRQIASLQVHIEQLQGAIVGGRDVDADQVIRLSSEHRRLLSQLRARAAKAKPSGPTLSQYLRDNYGAPEVEASDT